MVVEHIVQCCHIHLGNDAGLQQQLVIGHWPNKIYLCLPKTLTVVGHNEQTLFLPIYLIFSNGKMLTCKFHHFFHFPFLVFFFVCPTTFFFSDQNSD